MPSLSRNNAATSRDTLAPCDEASPSAMVPWRSLAKSRGSAGLLVGLLSGLGSFQGRTRQSFESCVVPGTGDLAGPVAAVIGGVEPQPSADRVVDDLTIPGCPKPTCMVCTKKALIWLLWRARTCVAESLRLQRGGACRLSSSELRERRW